MKRKLTILIPLVLTIFFLTSTPLCASAALMKSNGEQYTASAEAGAQENLTPVHADQVAEGTYHPVSVISSTSMFRVTDAALTVSDGSMSARITLGGTAYSHLYMGTDTDAAKADESQWIPYEENDDGSYSYTIPVEVLNKEIDCAAFSIRSNKWFPRTLIFESSSLPEGTVQEAASDPLEETLEAAPYAGSSDTVSKKKSYKKASDVKDSDIGYAAAAMEDGEYKIPVTLTGGSGRASIESPAAMIVKNKQARAEICWSSPNYDYMVVDGLLYEPINKDGNSVFEIPVTRFDGDMKVTADTTAMSQPHEIEYTLNFDSSQAELQGMSVKTKGIILLIIFVLVVAAGFIRGYLRRGKSDYDMQTAEELQKQQSSVKTTAKKKKKKKKRR